MFFDGAENKKKDIPQDVLPYLLDNIETIEAFLLAEKKEKTHPTCRAGGFCDIMANVTSIGSTDYEYKEVTAQYIHQ